MSTVTMMHALAAWCRENPSIDRYEFIFAIEGRSTKVVITQAAPKTKRKKTGL